MGHSQKLLCEAGGRHQDSKRHSTEKKDLIKARLVRIPKERALRKRLIEGKAEIKINT